MCQYVKKISLVIISRFNFIIIPTCMYVYMYCMNRTHSILLLRASSPSLRCCLFCRFFLQMMSVCLSYLQQHWNQHRSFALQYFFLTKQILDWHCCTISQLGQRLANVVKTLIQNRREGVNNNKEEPKEDNELDFFLLGVFKKTTHPNSELT